MGCEKAASTALITTCALTLGRRSSTLRHALKTYRRGCRFEQWFWSLRVTISVAETTAYALDPSTFQNPIWCDKCSDVT